MIGRWPAPRMRVSVMRCGSSRRTVDLNGHVRSHYAFMVSMSGGTIAYHTRSPSRRSAVNRCVVALSLWARQASLRYRRLSRWPCGSHQLTRRSARCRSGQSPTGGRSTHSSRREQADLGSVDEPRLGGAGLCAPVSLLPVGDQVRARSMLLVGRNTGKRQLQPARSDDPDAVSPKAGCRNAASRLCNAVALPSAHHLRVSRMLSPMRFADRDSWWDGVRRPCSPHQRITIIHARAGSRHRENGTAAKSVRHAAASM